MDAKPGPSYSPLALLPYLLLFMFFAIGALFSESSERVAVVSADGALASDGRPHREPTIPLMLVAGGVLMAVMIGTRFRVGGEWDTYTFYWDYAAGATLPDMLTFGDPAYQFLNWAGQSLGLDIWSVNLVCGALFSWGLIRFARTQPLPWLVVVIAIPYLVTVVAMGYTRQAVAIGLLLGGLASSFQGGSLLRFAAYVVLAALFHKTAVLALPLRAMGVEPSPNPGQRSEDGVNPRDRKRHVALLLEGNQRPAFIAARNDVDEPTSARQLWRRIACVCGQAAALRIATGTPIPR